MQLDFKEKLDQEHSVVLIKALESKYKLFTPLDIGCEQKIMRRCVYKGWLSKSVYGGLHKYSLTEQGRNMATLLQKITATNAANKNKQTKQGEQKENGY